jgi:hypothetical protein
MTSQLVVQHADGSAESHQFVQYDWFEVNVPWAYAGNGRVNFSLGRVLNNVLSGNPKLFETQVALANASSPVTNIVLQYLQAPSGNATTFFVALSGIQVKPPALTVTCSANLTVNFGSVPSPAATLAAFVAQGGTIADNCDTNPSLGSTDSLASACPMTLTRTYMVRDAVGASTSCQQIITVNNLFAADAIVWRPPLARAGMNEDTDPSAGGTVKHVFQPGSTIPLQVRVIGCGGVDITDKANVIGKAEVACDANCDGVAGTTPLPISFHGVGKPGGLMEKVGGQMKFNLDTGPLPKSVKCFTLKVTVLDTATGESSSETVLLQAR